MRQVPDVGHTSRSAGSFRKRPIKSADPSGIHAPSEEAGRQQGQVARFPTRCCAEFEILRDLCDFVVIFSLPGKCHNVLIWKYKGPQVPDRLFLCRIAMPADDGRSDFTSSQGDLASTRDGHCLLPRRDSVDVLDILADLFRINRRVNRADAGAEDIQIVIPRHLAPALNSAWALGSSGFTAVDRGPGRRRRPALRTVRAKANGTDGRLSMTGSIRS